MNYFISKSNKRRGKMHEDGFDDVQDGDSSADSSYEGSDEESDETDSKSKSFTIKDGDSTKPQRKKKEIHIQINDINLETRKKLWPQSKGRRVDVENLTRVMNNIGKKKDSRVTIMHNALNQFTTKTLANVVEFDINNPVELNKKFNHVFKIEGKNVNIYDMSLNRSKYSEEEEKNMKEVYDQILSKDIKTEEISKFNFSGNDICKKKTFYKSKQTRVLRDLNFYTFNIWLVGFKGMVTLSRKYCSVFVESFFIDNFLMLCVFGNTIILGMDGLVSSSAETLLVNLNLTFTVIFSVEMIIKLYGFGLRKYASDYFNIFDGIVVILSMVEIVIEQITAASSSEDTTATTTTTTDEEEESTTSGTSAISAFRAIRIFRTFRVLRVTRALRGLRFMKVIVEVIGGAIEQFTYIALL